MSFCAPVAAIRRTFCIPQPRLSSLCSDPIELLSISKLHCDRPTHWSLCISFLSLECSFLGLYLATTFPPLRCQLTFHFLMARSWPLETGLADMDSLFVVLCESPFTGLVTFLHGFGLCLSASHSLRTGSVAVFRFK